jgi:hypothetical protein
MLVRLLYTSRSMSVYTSLFACAFVSVCVCVACVCVSMCWVCLCVDVRVYLRVYLRVLVCPCVASLVCRRVTCSCVLNLYICVTCACVLNLYKKGITYVYKGITYLYTLRM